MRKSFLAFLFRHKLSTQLSQLLFFALLSREIHVDTGKKTSNIGVKRSRISVLHYCYECSLRLNFVCDTKYQYSISFCTDIASFGACVYVNLSSNFGDKIFCQRWMEVAWLTCAMNGLEFSSAWLI